MRIVRIISFFIFIVCVCFYVNKANYSIKGNYNTLRLPGLFSDNSVIEKIVKSKQLGIKDKIQLLNILDYIKEEPKYQELKNLFYNKLTQVLMFFKNTLEKKSQRLYLNQLNSRKNNYFSIIYNWRNLGGNNLETSLGLCDLTTEGLKKHSERRDQIYKFIKTNDVQGLKQFFYTVLSNDLDRKTLLSGIYNEDGSFLHIACKFGYPEMIRLLLKEGVDVNLLDQQGNKALFYLMKNFNLLVYYRNEKGEFGKKDKIVFDKLLRETKNKHRIIYDAALKYQNVNILLFYLPEMKLRNRKYIFDKLEDNFIFYQAIETLIRGRRLPKEEVLRIEILRYYIGASLHYRKLVTNEEIVRFIYKLDRTNIYVHKCIDQNYSDYSSAQLLKTIVRTSNEFDEFKEEVLMVNNLKYETSWKIIQDLREKNLSRKNKKNLEVLIKERLINMNNVKTKGIDWLKKEAIKCAKAEISQTKFFEFIKKKDVSDLEDHIEELYIDYPNDDIEWYANSLRTKDFKTLLITAVYENNIKMVEYLLSIGANINDKQNHKSVLHIAVENLNFDMIELLLKNGVNINIKDRKNSTVLHILLQLEVKDRKKQEKRKEIFNFFMSRNDLDINALDARDAKGAIHYVMDHKDNYCLKRLLKRGDLVIDLKDFHNDTALHLAIIDGDLAKVKMLIKRGADITAKGKKKETLLDLAIKKGRMEIITYLLKEGQRKNKTWNVLYSLNRLSNVVTEHFSFKNLSKKFGQSLFCDKLYQYQKNKAWKVKYIKKRRTNYEIAQCFILSNKGQIEIGITDTYIEIHKLLEKIIPKEKYIKAIEDFFKSKGKKDSFKNLIKPIERLLNLDKENIMTYVPEDVKRIMEEVRGKFKIKVDKRIIEALFSNLTSEIIKFEQRSNKTEYVIDLDEEEIICALSLRRLVDDNNKWVGDEGIHIILRNGFNYINDNELAKILSMKYLADRAGCKIEWLLNAEGIKKAEKNKVLRRLVKLDMVRLVIVSISGELLSETRDIYTMRTQIRGATHVFLRFNQHYKRYLLEELPLREIKYLKKFLDTFNQTEESLRNKKKVFEDTHIRKKYVIGFLRVGSDEDHIIKEVRSLDSLIVFYRDKNLILLRRLVLLLLGKGNYLLRQKNSSLLKNIFMINPKERTMNNYLKMRAHNWILNSA